jgi:5'-nucleotidase
MIGDNMKLKNSWKLGIIFLIVVTFFTMTLTSCKQMTDYSITVLATNDIHGHFDTLPEYSTIIKQLRSENKNVLLLDAGDFFKRGPFESYHGKIEIDLFNKMGYDAMVLGNNEFKVPGSTDSTNSAGTLKESDYQISNIISWAKFPILCGNVKLKKTGQYISGTKPYITKEIGGLKIGIIGIANTEPSDSKLDMATDKDFTSGEKTVSQLLPEVKKNSDIKIVLSHAGMTINRLMTGVSAIISGHDHIKLQPPEVSHGIPITQGGGENDHYLYRLDLSFKLENSKWVLKSFTSKLYTANGVTKDTEIQKIIDSYESKPIPALKAA